MWPRRESEVRSHHDAAYHVGATFLPVTAIRARGDDSIGNTSRKSIPGRRAQASGSAPATISRRVTIAWSRSATLAGSLSHLLWPDGWGSGTITGASSN